jgi:hypothetical protein
VQCREILRLTDVIFDAVALDLPQLFVDLLQDEQRNQLTKKFQEEQAEERTLREYRVRS